jgi:hypothetical protein
MHPDIKELSLVLLKELAAELKTKFADGYYTKVLEEDECNSLYTDNFILSFSFEDSLFYITFKIGQTGQYVALLMSIILKYLTVEEMMFLKDSYYDDVQEKLVFGHEAIEVKHNEILDQQGNCKCPLCERAVPKKHIGDSGFCKTCDTVREHMVWH